MMASFGSSNRETFDHAGEKEKDVHYPLSGISHDCSRAFWVHTRPALESLWMEQSESWRLKSSLVARFSCYLMQMHDG